MADLLSFSSSDSSSSDDEAAADERARQYEGTSAFAELSAKARSVPAHGDFSPPPLEDQGDSYDSPDDDRPLDRPPSDDDFPAYDPRDYESAAEEGAETKQNEMMGDISEESEEEEEFNEAALFDNPENAKIEYVGRYQMDVSMDLEVDDSFLVTTEPGAVPRMVVVDAANILHGFTPLLAGNNAPDASEQRVDAAYILSLVRFFVKRGIECMVVTLHKYTMDNVIENTFIIKTLKELGLLMTMDSTYDDLVLFAVAGEFDAVILTEDQFKDERRSVEFLTPNVKHTLNNLRVSPIYPRNVCDFLQPKYCGKVSKNGHFVVDHLMRFEGTTDVLRSKFFSTAERGGHRFELVQEKYESWLNRKDEVLSALDALLAQIQPIMKKKREDFDARLLPRGN